MESFPARRNESAKETLRKTSKTSVLLPVLALFIMATVATAAIPCSADSQCRRDVCILKACTTRPKTGGACEANNHCFNSATESCIASRCVARSSTGEICEETTDCSSSKDQCLGGMCTTPFDPFSMVWEGNVSPLAYSSHSPGVAVDGKLIVFEASTTGDANTVEVFDPVGKTWTNKDVSPVFSTYGHSVVAIGTNVFLAGGSYSSALTSFYRYETGSDTWERWPDLPFRVQAAALAAVGNTVFLFGGQGDSGDLKTILSFDTTSKDNAWVDTKALLPSASNGISATTVDTDIYLTGGTGGANSALKYDSTNPSTNPSILNPLIQGRSNHMSFYEPKSKRLYVVGGLSRADVYGQDAVEYLDLSSPGNSWISANAPNFVRTGSSPSGALIDSVFYFAGNQILQVLDVSKASSVRWKPFANTGTPTVYDSTVAQLTAPNKITVVDTSYANPNSVYDIASDSWTPGSYIPLYYISRCSSAFANDQLFVMGGSYTSGIANVYSLNSAGDAWTQQDDMPAGRGAGCAAADGKDIYFFGGAAETNPVNDLFKMDTSIDPGNNLQWTTVTPKGSTPTAVMFCAAVVVDKKLLIFGGDTDSSGSSPTGLIQSFDIASQTWDSPLSAEITPRSRLSAVFLKGFVFIVGGTNDNGATALAKTEVFDVKAQTVKPIANLLNPRFNIGLATDGTSLFAVGGQVYGGASFPSLEKLRTP